MASDMDTANRALYAALLVFLTLMVACTDSQGGKDSSTSIPDSYQKYEENGVSFSYPETWSFSYDDTPSIYTDRGIGLDISEFSTATLLISEGRSLDLDYVTNRFLSGFQVPEGDFIDNFTRNSVSIGGIPAETATWEDQFLGKTQYELTVAKIQSKPHDVFVVFSLSDEDIDQSQEHKERFLKSIRIQ
ncbi:hypothetical protein OOT55_09710 [Marinimicrobium sp. C6131]|uniref:hypothetical protein n=1 Tax=Marinimicrobium sp. C6131 TaxID=3022676 RepID=UPI00223D8A61|nr:hypothetical protein [Marinimicrobium sp. C6131]UZJ42929.1 hypothetical protein OOT55_09710 [Marinimicrobium sp. C6131]